MNIVTTIREAVGRWLRGDDILPAKPERPIVNLAAACYRPTGDPLRQPHYYGRGDSRGVYCLRCGRERTR